jgi:plastocyanin
VTWINQDLIAHNIISNTGVFASGDLSSGQTYTFTFAEAGTYPYYCSYHPMNGVVIVKNP